MAGGWGGGGVAAGKAAGCGIPEDVVAVSDGAGGCGGTLSGRAEDGGDVTGGSAVWGVPENVRAVSDESGCCGGIVSGRAEDGGGGVVADGSAGWVFLRIWEAVSGRAEDGAWAGGCIWRVCWL